MVKANSECEDADQCGRAIAETLVKHHSYDLTEEEGRRVYTNKTLLENYQNSCLHYHLTL